MLTQICLTIATIGLVGERERGTFEQLLTTPLSVAEILLGEMIPYVGIGFLSLTILETGSYLFYGAIKGICSSRGFRPFFLFATVALGVVIAARVRHVQQGIFLGFLVMFPSILITGILVPTDNYPIHQCPSRIVSPRVTSLMPCTQSYSRGQDLPKCKTISCF